mmetsp:Transcript_41771/g.89692  ORF Transcript_41771/g.89692 Transcript_41771/m.89692 type:complete len:208 (+) Transcript_41771:617-1240(+)
MESIVAGSEICLSLTETPGQPIVELWVVRFACESSIPQLPTALRCLVDALLGSARDLLLCRGSELFHQAVEKRVARVQHRAEVLDRKVEGVPGEWPVSPELGDPVHHHRSLLQVRRAGAAPLQKLHHGFWVSTSQQAEGRLRVEDAVHVHAELLSTDLRMGVNVVDKLGDVVTQELSQNLKLLSKLQNIKNDDVPGRFGDVVEGNRC